MERVSSGRDNWESDLPDWFHHSPILERDGSAIDHIYFLCSFMSPKLEYRFLKDGSVVEIVRISPPSNVSSKIGLCPPYYALPHEGCALECYGDSQCPGDEKCCFAGCGYTCAPAVPIPTAKPGQCPAKVASDFNSSQAIMSDSCTKQCSNDAECLSNKKCCSHKNCDLVCTDPVGKDASTFITKKNRNRSVKSTLKHPLELKGALLFPKTQWLLGI